MSEARRPANARGGHLCDFKPAHVAASCRNGCASATERYPPVVDPERYCPTGTIQPRLGTRSRARRRGRGPVRRAGCERQRHPRLLVDDIPEEWR